MRLFVTLTTLVLVFAPSLVLAQVRYIPTQQKQCHTVCNTIRTQQVCNTTCN